MTSWWRLRRSAGRRPRRSVDSSETSRESVRRVTITSSSECAGARRAVASSAAVDTMLAHRRETDSSGTIPVPEDARASPFDGSFRRRVARARSRRSDDGRSSLSREFLVAQSRWRFFWARAFGASFEMKKHEQSADDESYFRKEKGKKQMEIERRRAARESARGSPQLGAQGDEDEAFERGSVLDGRAVG